MAAQSEGHDDYCQLFSWQSAERLPDVPADAIYVGKPRFAVTPVLGDDPGVAPRAYARVSQRQSKQTVPKTRVRRKDGPSQPPLRPTD